MADPEESGEEKSVKEVLQELERRVDTLEDRVMMERLEDLSLEDEIEVVEDFLGRQEEDIKKKLQMLDRIEEEYAESQVEDKLQYLYQQLNKVKERQEQMDAGGGGDEEIGEMQDRIEILETRMQELKSGDEEQDLDDVYDKLYTLRDRVKSLQEDLGSEEGLQESEVEEIVREVLKNTDLDVRAEMDAEAAPGAELRESVSGLREELNSLRQSLGEVDQGEEIEELARRVNEMEEELIEREMAEVDAEEMLEEVDYDEGELGERLKEILIRIEQLRDEVETQGERMDNLSHAQNIFESNIGSLMEDQKELTDILREEDKKLERKTDLLLEALEEGLEMEEEELQEMLESGLEEVAESEVQSAIRESFTGDDVELKGSKDMVLENQARIKELKEKIEDMEKHSPTIIE